MGSISGFNFDQFAGQYATITIENNCDEELNIDHLYCIEEDSCRGMNITFSGDVVIEICDCGDNDQGCEDTSGFPAICQNVASTTITPETPEPTVQSPSVDPTTAPSPDEASDAPTMEPTDAPSSEPTIMTTESTTTTGTTVQPTGFPTDVPSDSPTSEPSTTTPYMTTDSGSSDSDDDDDSDSSSNASDSIESDDEDEDDSSSDDNTSSPESLSDDSSSDDMEQANAAVQALERLQPESVQREGHSGELMVSLSPSTMANIWAVAGLLLLVNIAFCLYKVCRTKSKTRYFSESDHYESQAADVEDVEFKD